MAAAFSLDASLACECATSHAHTRATTVLAPQVVANPIIDHSTIYLYLTTRTNNCITSGQIIHTPKMPVTTADVAQNRRRLSRMLQMHGYSACRESLVLLEDHYSSANHYKTMEEFVSALNRVMMFDLEGGSSIIDSDLAHSVIQKLRKAAGLTDDCVDELEADQHLELPTQLTIKVRDVLIEHTYGDCITGDHIDKANEFKMHYNFLHKRLSALPVFKGDFHLTKLSTLTASTQASIRCICFGLLVKDLSKIDGYTLIDDTGRVPMRITPDTTFRNRLAYSNCIVLVEGVYMNPDDMLYAATIGLPPVLLDPIKDKALACADDKFIAIMKDLYLDDEDVCKSLDTLFKSYNSMQEPPFVFVLIGNFTREPCEDDVFRKHSKKLVKILKSCDKLSNSHFVLVPGQHDTIPTLSDKATQLHMPKKAITRENMHYNLLRMSHFERVQLATNPTHIHVGDRQITIVAHSYLKELHKNLLHDLSDQREELFDTAKRIILSNAHLSAGITKVYHSAMNLWHKPDLLVLADTDAFGNRYDYSECCTADTSFATLPSFARQFSKFKLYNVKSGEIRDLTTDKVKQQLSSEQQQQQQQQASDDVMDSE